MFSFLRIDSSCSGAGELCRTAFLRTSAASICASTDLLSQPLAILLFYACRRRMGIYVQISAATPPCAFAAGPPGAVPGDGGGGRRGRRDGQRRGRGAAGRGAAGDGGGVWATAGTGAAGTGLRATGAADWRRRGRGRWRATGAVAGDGGGGAGWRLKLNVCAGGLGGRRPGLSVHQNLALSISRAQLYPGAPITPPPGCAPEPQR